ncbi:MAG: hypothetical protein K6G00_09745 [Treponema sp.]|nr:hypothetical protein [Treponema sp.]
MKKYISSIIIVISFTIISISALESPYFTGYAGFSGNFTSDSNADKFDPAFYSASYFGGQINFFDTLIFRSEFSIETGNIFAGNIFESTERSPSFFKLQEVSATYKFNTSSLKHYISIFYGEYEPIGSDIFLQRQFGITKISSHLTETWQGINGGSINHFYGGGISYAVRLEQPIAFGTYLYKNHNDYYNQDSINMDLRIAGAFPMLTFDASSGISLSSGSTEGTLDEYALIIREASFHGGFNFLIGNSSELISIYSQAGFSNLIFAPGKDNHRDDTEQALDELYFLIEPRVNLRQLSFALTFFNIPYSKLQSGAYEYIHNPMGISATVSTNYFHLGDLNYTMGMHATLTLSDRPIKSAINDGIWKRNFYISPYANFPLFGGELSSSLTINCTQLFKFNKNWFSSVDYRLGFRSQF